MNKPISTPLLILPFEAIRNSDLPSVGGKGANLGEMSHAGFPVPSGFCVTTAAFQKFIAACPQSEAIYHALDDIHADDVAAAQETGKWVREHLAAVPVPGEIAQAVHNAWEAEGVEHAYAVRSSATAEDLPQASFAGQQDTFLNVTGRQALLDSVRNCWISLFTGRAILYRLQNGFSHRDVHLSVIVQRMVLPDVSGILFTADPITGRRHIASIDAGFGLGEAFVAGLVSADLYKVDKNTSTVVEANIAEKKMAIRPLAGGGTAHEALEGDQATTPALTNEQAIQLADMGTRIEAHYGQPQDIEWAMEGGQIFILQSRPITSLFPIPKRALQMAGKTGQLQVMFSFAAVQGMLDPMTRLGQDIIMGAFGGAASLFGQGNLSPTEQNVLWPAGERLWVNFTSLIRHPVARKAVKPAFSMVEPGASQAMAQIWDDPRVLPTPGWFKLHTVRHMARFFGPVILRTILTLRRPAKGRRRFQDAVDTLLDEFQTRSQSRSTFQQQVALLTQFLRTGFAQFIPAFLPVMAGGMASLNLLFKLSESLDDGDFDPLLLTRGLPHNVTTEMDLALWKTARQIKSDDESAACFNHQEAAALATLYLDGQLPATAQAVIKQFMDQYGMRGIAEIDIGRRRWREEPTHIMQVLQSYLKIEEEALAPDVIFAKGAAEAEAAIEPFAAALRQTRGGWLKARLARIAASRMRSLAGVRESPKFFIIRLFGFIRANLLACGQEQVKLGRLNQPDDLFHLTFDELRSFADGDNQDWISLVAARRAAYAREQRRMQLPRLLLSDGHAFYGDGQAAAGTEGTISGDPVSPGVVEGRVNVVFDPQNNQLQPGEILVCPGTDPAWTPLFLAAAGLVMEVGGLMTHGSVVAREYGIPAVVGVYQATSRLKHGQLIRVDGSSGAITLLEDVPEEPSIS